MMEAGRVVKDETANAVREFYEQLQELRTEIGLVASNLTGTLLPVLVPVINALTALFTGIRNVTDEWPKMRTEISKPFTGVANAIASILDPFIEIWNRLATVVPGISPIPTIRDSGGGTPLEGGGPPGVGAGAGGGGGGGATPRGRPSRYIDPDLLQFGEFHSDTTGTGTLRGTPIYATPFGTLSPIPTVVVQGDVNVRTDTAQAFEEQNAGWQAFYGEVLGQ